MVDKKRPAVSRRPKAGSDRQGRSAPKPRSQGLPEDAPKGRPRNRLAAAEAALRKAGMAFPEVTEDFPWGHRALKVKGKAFIFMSNEDGAFGLSVKLPQSADFALMQPFAKPTGYGLGKAGWVSASFTAKDALPLPLLIAWLTESYRAVAPKKLAALVPS